MKQLNYFAATIILSSFAPLALAQPTDSPATEIQLKDAASVKALCERNETQALGKTLSKLNERYAAQELPEYVHAMSLFIGVIDNSPVANDSVVKPLSEKYAAMVFGRAGEERTTAGCYREQLQLFFDVLGNLEPSHPEFSKARTMRAIALLKKWGELDGSIAYYLPYDMYKPQVRIEQFDPERYQIPFKEGMAPEGISDPKARKAYEDYLKQRDAFITNSGHLSELNQLHRRYLPSAAKFLGNVYASTPDEQVELAQLIAKHVRGEKSAAELVRAVKAVRSKGVRSPLGEE